MVLLTKSAFESMLIDESRQSYIKCLKDSIKSANHTFMFEEEIDRFMSAFIFKKEMQLLSDKLKVSTISDEEKNDLLSKREALSASKHVLPVEVKKVLGKSHQFHYLRPINDKEIGRIVSTHVKKYKHDYVKSVPPNLLRKFVSVEKSFDLLHTSCKEYFLSPINVDISDTILKKRVPEDITGITLNMVKLFVINIYINNVNSIHSY